MDQNVYRKEYDCALVCAIAVLGVNPFRVRWRDLESYPPIISEVIKVAYFIIVRKAVELEAAHSDKEDEFSPCGSPCQFDGDSGYESEFHRPIRVRQSQRSSPGSEDSHGSGQHSRRSRASSQRRSSPPPQHRSSLQWVQIMMDRFMVRRTNSPIDWLMDLRTYGLKIHYNTTAPGHVMWKDKYVLQYKHVSFSMA